MINIKFKTDDNKTYTLLVDAANVSGKAFKVTPGSWDISWGTGCAIGFDSESSL